ncbi:meprin A subunit beta-like [Syngnathoides biaculeatus]|uniref:meprin A subunit beta-like n=1 Tax=Syngnathoides biaculeatus TaxID=300417 RepID=UPI002ADD7B6F|nr:meprin A subunit beta-like [Syngnathoides biaculeatus]
MQKCISLKWLEIVFSSVLSLSSCSPSSPAFRSHCSFLTSTSHTTMATAHPQPRPRGIDYSLPTCGEVRCNGRGICVLPPGGGSGFACECDLGYLGQSCEKTFNGSISLPLTLGVVAVLIGVVILAFVFAKLRQKQKQRKRDSLQNLPRQVLCDAGPSH